MMKERKQRRLSAIMVVDVVGFSTLMEADESSTLSTIQALRDHLLIPRIAEHSGRVVKFLGDGALAEFSSAVDAVECAASIQKRLTKESAIEGPLQKVQLRIGVNVGDVVVDGEDVLGDGVNVASRLEQLCDVGGVLISGTVFDQIQGKAKIKVKDRGSQRVKNITRPIRTYAIIFPKPKKIETPKQPKAHTGKFPRVLILVFGVTLVLLALKSLDTLRTNSSPEGQVSYGPASPTSHISEVLLPVTEGASLRKMLMDQGADPNAADEIQTVLVANFAFDFRAGEWVRIGVATDPVTGGSFVVRLSLYDLNEVHIATVALSDNGRYVAASEPSDAMHEYQLQFMASDTESGALALFDVLKARHKVLEPYAPEIESRSVGIPGRYHYRLRVGRFASREQAASVCEEIRNASPFSDDCSPTER